MKKLSFILLPLLLVILTGCSGSGSRTKTDQKYMVSAIGFDGEGDTICMTAEAIVVNSENTEEEQRLVALTGRGRTVQEAVEEIGRGIAKPLIVSHCGVILLGETLSAEQVGEICSFCFDKEEITLSTYVMTTEKSAALLSCEPVSSLSVGYDLMGLIEQQSTRTGVNFKNRYYEVEAGRERKQGLFTVPVILVQDGEFSIGGLAVYQKDRLAARVEVRETPLYALLTDSFTKGRLVLGGQELTIQKADTRYSFIASEPNAMQICVEITLTANKPDLLNELEREISLLAEKLTVQSGTDVFGFQAAWEREDEKAYREAENHYESLYRGAEITVRCRKEQK